ncbi:DgyrCDS9418 [Dimorphilus gyrociliatus]|uniref:DgyrCDS9418 n=1 Tax=Dimorphilus gyrociliatus TaxID=2664684 RepID=A0A7I8VWY5_9ANNE|nr:DgyrCDS9418 [Dimorphilus gyrociliatus]
MIHQLTRSLIINRHAKKIYNILKTSYSGSCWKELNVHLLTNNDMWQERPNPIKINAKYIDTGHELPVGVKLKHPNVLLLPNIPGDKSDLRRLAEKFHENHCRVIIPDWPLFGGSRIESRIDRKFFNFETEELALYVLNFLNNISIDRIDSIVCHGNAIAAGLTLATQIRNSMRLKQFTSILPPNIFSFDDSESKKTKEKLEQYLELPQTTHIECYNDIDLAKKQSHSLVFHKESGAILEDDLCLNIIMKMHSELDKE